MNKLVKNRSKKVAFLYDNILNNYVNLQKSLGFDNPLSMYSLYCFMYSNGFLSRYHCFYGKTDVYNCEISLGLNVIFGEGCCRHIACLFDDILKKTEMRGYQLNVYNESYAEKMKNKSFAHKFAKIVGNHVINAVLYDRLVYYFDPTYHRIYTLNGDVLSDDEMSYRLKKSYFHFQNGVSYRMFDEIISMPDYDGGYDEFYDDMLVYMDNEDIFEDFYNDNYRMYREAKDEYVKMILKK